MKKVLVVMLAVFSLVTILSCSNPTSAAAPAYVRIENLLSNGGAPFTFDYGVRFGQAEYIGSLPCGYTTSYYECDLGSYTFQALANTGSWLTLTTPYNLTGSGHWTLVISGDLAGTVYCYFIKDY